MASAVDIRHLPAEHRWIAEVDGQIIGQLGYLPAGGALHFTHTEVDPRHQGRGIASELVRTGFGYASDQQLRVIPRCSYVSAWTTRHPEVAHVIDA